MSERIHKEIDVLACSAWETHPTARPADHFSLIRASSLAEKIINMLGGYINKPHPGQPIDDVFIDLDKYAIGVNARLHGVNEFFENGGIEHIVFEERFNLEGFTNRRQLVMRGFHPEATEARGLIYEFCGWDIKKTESLNGQIIQRKLLVEESDIELITQVLSKMHDKVNAALINYRSNISRK